MNPEVGLTSENTVMSLGKNPHFGPCGHHPVILVFQNFIRSSSVLAFTGYCCQKCPLGLSKSAGCEWSCEMWLSFDICGWSPSAWAGHSASHLPRDTPFSSWWTVQARCMCLYCKFTHMSISCFVTDSQLYCGLVWPHLTVTPPPWFSHQRLSILLFIPIS